VPTFEKSVSGLAKRQSPELLTHWREFALRGLGDKFLLPRLRLAPIASVEALTEALPIDEEMCVPRLTAFFEGHVAGLLSSASEIVSLLSKHDTALMVKKFERFEKARLAASTSLFGLPSPPPR
jgi:hypothetical protein